MYIIISIFANGKYALPILFQLRMQICPICELFMISNRHIECIAIEPCCLYAILYVESRS